MLLKEIKLYKDINGDDFNSTLKSFYRFTDAMMITLVTPKTTSLPMEIKWLLDTGVSIEAKAMSRPTDVASQTEQVEYPQGSGTFETWNVWQYQVSSVISATIAVAKATSVKLSFSQNEVINDGLANEYVLYDTFGQTTISVSPTIEAPSGQVRDATNFDILQTEQARLDSTKKNKATETLTDWTYDPANGYLEVRDTGGNYKLKVEDFVNTLQVVQTLTIQDPNTLEIVTLTYDSSDVGGDVLSINYADGKSLQVGQEQWLHGYNVSGSNILNGKAVSIDGSQGNRPTIQLATNADETIAHKTLGVATEDINNLGYGKVTTFGLVRGLNIGSGFVEGDIVYLGIDGALTNVEPTAPTPHVEIGVVLKVNGGSINTLFVTIDKLHKTGAMSDVDNTGKTDGDLLIQNASGVYVNYNVEKIKFDKTGWDINAPYSISVDNGTRTFTLTANQDLEYYIKNVKYTMSALETKTVVFNDVEGAWFITLGTNGNLVASQTAWDFIDIDYVWVAELYWDATNKQMVHCAWEGHSYVMDAPTHRDLHWAVSTYKIGGGLQASINGNNIDMTGGIIGDEDIAKQIIDSDTPTNDYEQPLSPLQAPIIYRDGLNGNLRRIAPSVVPFIITANKVQLNPNSGGGTGYELVNMTNNKYGAYWIIVTTDPKEPIKIFPGQVEADTLEDAKGANGLLSMDFGGIPIQEILVHHRIMVKQTTSAPYYVIESIEDFYVDKVIGVPNAGANSHGALSGLLDDDHTQYFNQTRGDARYYQQSEVDTLISDEESARIANDNLKVDKDLTPYIEQLAGTASGNELVYVYDTDDTTTKKMTLSEIYTGANTATGSFVASGDYSPNGLTANESVYVKTITPTLNVNADVFVDIKAPTTNQVVKVTFPTIASTSTARLSMDNGVTYSIIKLNGQQVVGTEISGKTLELTFDGTFWVDTVALDVDSTIQTVSNAVNSFPVGTVGGRVKAIVEGYTDPTTAISITPSITTRNIQKFDKTKYTAVAYDYLINVKTAVNYTWSESIGYKLYDSSQVEIATGTASTVLTTGASFISFNNNIADTDTFMLVEGLTLPLTYVPYQENLWQPNQVTRSVPDGTTDLLRCSVEVGTDLVDTDKWEYVQKVKEYTLQSADINFLFEETNVDVVRIKIDNNDEKQFVDLVQSVLYPNKNFIIYNNRLLISSIGSYSLLNNGGFNYIYLTVAKGTYADLAAAQADLAGTEIFYELATPITTELSQLDNIIAFPNGDMIQNNLPTTIKYVTSLNKDSAFKGMLKTTEQQDEQIAEIFRILASNAIVEV